MFIILLLVYLIFGIIIIAPLIQGDLFKADKKYSMFRYVSILLAIWWVIDFIRLNTTSGFMLYYLTLLIFPTVYLFLLFFYVAIKKYFNSTIHPIFFGYLITFFVIDLFIATTNSLHHLMFISNPTNTLVFADMLTLDPGIFFYIHTLMSYSLILVIIVHILKNIILRIQLTKDIFPFVFIILSFAIGVGLNIYHLFFNLLILDPTLLTIVIFLSVLYYTFYIRDLKLLLVFNRNRFILNHLREKYVVVDELGYVRDASSEFINQFGISLEDKITYNELLIKMKETAVLFDDSQEIETNYQPNKIYLNTLKKEIHLPFYKHSGTFYLFFDQTANVKYVYDMNYIKTHDLMTQLYNRNYLEEIRDNLDDSDIHYHIAIFDVDGLKLVNDYLGHNQGDEHLKRFARQLKSAFNDNETYPIRLGGDEFIILAINKDTSYIESIVDSIQEANNNLPFIDKIHFSYSIAKRTKESNTVKKVLSDADQGMYLHKNSKSNYKELLEIELQKLQHKES